MHKYDIRVDLAKRKIRWWIHMNEFFMSEATNAIGINGLLSMIVSLVCVACSWWALQNLKLDLFIRYPKSPQGRLLQLLLAIVIGSLVADFLLQYLGWSHQLRFMF